MSQGCDVPVGPAADGDVLSGGRRLSPEPQPGPRCGERLYALLREHRVAIRAAATAVGAENVRVFGSVAPGGTPESDIDLLVDFPAGERGLFPLLTMVEEVEQLLGRPVESWGDRDGSSPATRSRAAR